MPLEDRLQAALDRQEVAEFIVTNSMLGDSRKPGDWERYRRRYAERITIDYSSTLKDEVRSIDRETLMPYWKSLVDAFDVTQHRVTNVVVTLDGDTAKSRAYVVSNHRIGQDVWSCGGIYDARPRARCGRGRRLEDHRARLLPAVRNRRSRRVRARPRQCPALAAQVRRLR
ncbi:nuclear transport factor 2 family protein [Hydrocarboniphaga effusa]|uniref:nuclear transport factor 2 family protein n=1 Tax=Hydrocarboniphaga effusa TaxID=243629 RepID=UPI003137D702